MKKVSIFIALALMILILACNKEEPVKPSADFTTNLDGNTAIRGRTFTVYLDNVQGEFLVYFRGHNEQSTYDSSNPRRAGTNISRDADSVVVAGYPAAGEYVFTLVASSSGNWAQDYVQDVKSINVSVVEPTGK